MAFKLIYVAAALIGGLVETSAVPPNIVLDGSRDAQFLYNASGQLVASLAPAFGTDGSGNGYIAGFTTYDPVGGTFTNQSNGVFQVGEVVGGVPDQANAAQVNAISGELVLDSGKNAAPNNDALVLSAFAGQPNTRTGNSLNPILQALDSAGSSDVDFWLSGTVIKASDTGSIYTWQNPTFASGYTAGTVAQYRRDSFDNVVWDLAFVQTTGVAGAGGAVITQAVPAEYRPKSARMVPCTWESTGSAAKGSATLVFNTNGTISLLWPSTTASGDKFAVVVSIPLGNIQ